MTDRTMRLSAPRVPSPSAARPPQALTPREKQIVGLTNRRIAARLTLSIKTVEAHRATIMKKVRVSNTAQQLKAAIGDRLITLQD